ncbi:MAG: lipoyl synthase [Nitrospirae bacterium]|nr:lipoyl synthase [Nitrospirota bacterium]
MANIVQRIPKWSTKRIKLNSSLHKTKGLLRDLRLNTVCESARCPNISDCFSKPTATFMILGDVCSRQCSFCSVEKGVPMLPDASEPKRIAEAVKRLGLRHVVITSVTRDDLADGGAGHFADVIKELSMIDDSGFKIQIEVLTPDFRGSINALKNVVSAGPHIFNHNLETVPRLYSTVRPQADYKRSLEVLKNVKEMAPAIYTKSGIMVGFGETEQEVIDVMRDLRGVGCNFITIGQYLQPRKENLPVYEYIRPEVFERYKKIAEGLGFLRVASGPLVRSSFNAEEMIIT